MASSGNLLGGASASATGLANGSRRAGLGHSHSHASGGPVRGADAGNAPVARLIKALSHSTPNRSLTCLLFGEKSPTIVVGDNRGAVTVYRVLEPVTITHEGIPLFLYSSFLYSSVPLFLYSSFPLFVYYSNTLP